MRKVGVLFPLSGRSIEDIHHNKKEPKDFYYGIDKIIEKNNHEIEVCFIESRMSSTKIFEAS